jgi:hypothetical protein
MHRIENVAMAISIERRIGIVGKFLKRVSSSFLWNQIASRGLACMRYLGADLPDIMHQEKYRASSGRTQWHAGNDRAYICQNIH